MAAQFQASPVALLSETSSGGGTPPSNLPPRVLNKDLVFYHLTRIRMYDVTIESPPEQAAASDDGIRTVQRVFAYKKGQVKWVYSSKVPYAFLGRLVDGHDFIPLDYNKHFGIVEHDVLSPPPSPQLEHQDSESSSKSIRSAQEEETCLLCMEPYSRESKLEEHPMEQEFFDKLPFTIGVCGHKMCRSCWRKNSSMVVNNAAPGFPELNVLCDAVCPFCKGDIDMVSKDRENIVRQWQDEDEFIDIDDLDALDEDDDEEEDTVPENAAADGPLCGLCRQPGHNRRTCPLNTGRGRGRGRARSGN